MENHYDMLQLPRRTTAQEIKKAFHLLALRWHPDKHKQNGVSESEAKLRFQQIKTSHEVLKALHEQKGERDATRARKRTRDGGRGEANRGERATRQCDQIFAAAERDTL
ncbi:DnaJ sub C member 21 [Phytophthora pseudosyringae]|uniref:DnaJ sub C member 21 n=1 Tax=Phytophthora pseudosyringae TaxID=221518 RepID=A0A8T1WMR3_9STRA|nr:DnaJ sub C member 21 [Phytophthora pseudosyringae]